MKVEDTVKERDYYLENRRKSCNPRLNKTWSLTACLPFKIVFLCHPTPLPILASQTKSAMASFSKLIR